MAPHRQPARLEEGGCVAKWSREVPGEYGLFAQQDFRKGDHVADYRGVLLAHPFLDEHDCYLVQVNDGTLVVTINGSRAWGGSQTAGSLECPAEAPASRMRGCA